MKTQFHFYDTYVLHYAVEADTEEEAFERAKAYVHKDFAADAGYADTTLYGVGEEYVDYTDVPKKHILGVGANIC